MGFIKKTVSTTSTELEFMKTFIREFTAADERIVCETDETTINNIIKEESGHHFDPDIAEAFLKQKETIKGYLQKLKTF